MDNCPEIAQNSNTGYFDSIFNLAKLAGYKKIMVVRDSWSLGNWCIVNWVCINEKDPYGIAYGHINYANGNKHHGKIDDACATSWKLVRILDEEMTVKKA